MPAQETDGTEMLDKPLTVSVKQAAKLSTFGERTIWRKIKNGEIKSRIIGGRRLIPYAPFVDYLNGVSPE